MGKHSNRLFYCCSEYCPGYSYKASDRAHPVSTCGPGIEQKIRDEDLLYEFAGFLSGMACFCEAWEEKCTTCKAREWTEEKLPGKLVEYGIQPRIKA